MEVDWTGMVVVVLAKRTVDDAVTFEIPVTRTAVPVAATPATVPVMVVVLFAKGAAVALALSGDDPVPSAPVDRGRDEVTLAIELVRLLIDAEIEERVELISLAALLVAKGAFEVVALAEPAVASDRFGGSCHVKGGRGEEEGSVVGSVHTCVEMETDSVVVGGYAVLPETLEGRGRLVISVKIVCARISGFCVEELCGEAACCLGRTAAWIPATASAIECKRRRCIVTSLSWWDQMQVWRWIISHGKGCCRALVHFFECDSEGCELKLEGWSLFVGVFMCMGGAKTWGERHVARV